MTRCIIRVRVVLITVASSPISLAKCLRVGCARARKREIVRVCPALLISSHTVNHFFKTFSTLKGPGCNRVLGFTLYKLTVLICSVKHEEIITSTIKYSEMGTRSWNALCPACPRSLSLTLRSRSPAFLYTNLISRSNVSVPAFQILFYVPVSRSSTEKYFAFLKHNRVPPSQHPSNWAWVFGLQRMGFDMLNSI